MTYQCKCSCITADFPIARVEGTSKFTGKYHKLNRLKCKTCNYITAESIDTIRVNVALAAEAKYQYHLRCPCCNSIYSRKWF